MLIIFFIFQLYHVVSLRNFSGVNFRLSGPTSYYGRVDMSVDGVWGTICNRYWDNAEASAFCRSIGFNTGFPYHKKSDLQSKDDNFTIYEPNVHCKGKESSLLDCPHEGWKKAKSAACKSHEKDATVHCYNTGTINITVKHEFYEQAYYEFILIAKIIWNPRQNPFKIIRKMTVKTSTVIENSRLLQTHFDVPTSKIVM